MVNVAYGDIGEPFRYLPLDRFRKGFLRGRDGCRKGDII